MKKATFKVMLKIIVLSEYSRNIYSYTEVDFI